MRLILPELSANAAHMSNLPLGTSIVLEQEIASG